jgi:pimeloyl-ACP methyl ester carboxylesterase
MTAPLRVQARGTGAPVLVLLHGLGATGDVWAGAARVLAEQWPGRWLACDLPGHGGSGPLDRYSFGSLAAAVAGLVPGEEPVVVLGHSLGGVVGLTLASGWFAWSQSDLDTARRIAARPVTWFSSRKEAAERHLRVSGLVGLLDTDDPAVSAGLREQDGRWRLAVDPAAFGVGAPDMPGLLAAARGEVLLARGEHDPMVSDEQLAALHPATVTLPGLGHSAHVEDPATALRLLERYTG